MDPGSVIMLTPSFICLIFALFKLSLLTPIGLKKPLDTLKAFQRIWRVHVAYTKTASAANRGMCSKGRHKVRNGVAGPSS